MTGFPLHSPDVVLTDLALAVLGAVLAWRLAKSRGRGPITTSAVVLMGALASAAFWGAVFHAFFPSGTSTPAGFAAWVPVVLSILVVASTLVLLGLRLQAPGLPARARGAIVAAYAAAFAGVTLLVDASYRTIVLFYAPAVVFVLITSAAQAVRTRERGWWLVSAALALSVVAAVLQQARVAIHRAYFDHNAVYHVLQGIALVLLYRGFRPAPPRPS